MQIKSKTYNYLDCPCEICGVPFYEKGKKLRRLTDELVSLYPGLGEADGKIVGARLRFCTNSKLLRIKIELENVYTDRGFAFYESNVANVYVGEYGKSKLLGILSAENSYDENEIYETFNLDGNMNLITVYFPRNPTVKDIEITVDDNAVIEKPTPYTLEKPIVFYGSSIVENGHTSSVNAYTALVGRWLDADFYNFGFGGRARGEKEVCSYIAGIDCCAFIMDYDHNAPDVEHLRNTHSDFYKLYRSIHPETPIIMITKPYDDMPDTYERQEIIKKTYNDAVDCGDKNVYFIDGLSYFADIAEICTTDRTHPNALGHFFMAKKVTELLSDILDIKPIIW